MTKTHGGKRKGAGRKPYKKKSEKKVKCSIVMTPEHYRKTKGNRSALVEMGLNKLWSR